jgi:hypothetical protein
MIRAKLVPLCGACVLAVAGACALTASAASGAVGPSYFTCAKAKGGKFEKGCGSEGGKGGYVRKPVTAVEEYSGKQGPSELVFFIPGVAEEGDVTCQKATGKGAILDATQNEDTIRYEGCQSGGKPCTSEQAKEKKGDVTTSVLLGTLVATGEAASGVGVTIAAKGGGALASFGCEGLKVVVAGSITGEESGDVNLAAKRSQASFSVNDEGEPTIETEGSRSTLLSTCVLPFEEVTFASGETAVEEMKGPEYGIEP